MFIQPGEDSLGKTHTRVSDAECGPDRTPSVAVTAEMIRAGTGLYDRVGPGKARNWPLHGSGATVYCVVREVMDVGEEENKPG